MITVDGYVIDCAITEEHAFESEVSTYPIETGGDVTDNVRNLPIKVTIEGIVSDTPVGAVLDRRLADGDLPGFPSDDAYNRLKLIRARREPITITTSLATYDNMVLQNLTIPVDAKTGDVLRFTAVFQQVTLVTNLRTFVKVAIPAGRGKANLGPKAPRWQSNTFSRCLQRNSKSPDPGKNHPDGGCTKSETVLIDAKTGKLYRPDGKTELTQDEINTMNRDDERGARYGTSGNKAVKKGYDPYGRYGWLDSDGILVEEINTDPTNEQLRDVYDPNEVDRIKREQAARDEVQRKTAWWYQQQPDSGTVTDLDQQSKGSSDVDTEDGLKEFAADVLTKPDPF
jgi:hypothetical protein